jgi:MFS family permease
LKGLDIDRRAAGLLIAFGVFGVFWGGWAAVLPDIKEAVRGSDSAFGFALLGVGVGAVPAMAGMGRIYDRFQERTVAPLLTLFAVSTVLPGLTSSTNWLFVTLLGVGALSGMLDVAINAAATAWEARTNRRLLSLVHASFSGSFLVASITVGLARRADAGHMLILISIAAVVALAAPFNRFPRSEEDRKKTKGGFRFDPVFLMLGALCGLAFVIEGGLEAWSAVHLERTLNASPAVGGLGPGLFAAAMLCGRSAAHVLGDRLGDRRLLLTGSAIAAIGLAVSALAPTVLSALSGFAITGLGVAVAAPTIFGVAGRAAAGTMRGSAIGTVTTVAYLGFLLGPPMVGWISGASALRMGFVFLAAIAVTLGALSALIAKVGPAAESTARAAITS